LAGCGGFLSGSFWLNEARTDSKRGARRSRISRARKTTIHFTKEPQSIRTGDYLVYYAAVHQRLYGIVEIFSPSQLDAQRKRWPYHAEVRPKLIIRHMSRAPSVDALNVPGRRDFRKTVRQMDFAALTEAEYQLALAAIDKACDKSLGDYRDPKFNKDR
jgi:hypothetical protein